jgi:transcription factor SPN1
MESLKLTINKRETVDGDLLNHLFGESEDDEQAEAAPRIEREEQDQRCLTDTNPKQKYDNELLRGDKDSFIDDAEVAFEDRDNRDDRSFQYASEAEEEEILFEENGKVKTKRRRERRGEESLRLSAIEFISKMEAAAEEDSVAYSARRPAVHKVRLLSEVQQKLSILELHKYFIKYGLLSVLRIWLEPLPDGNLPNINIRSCLVRLISLLPLDTEDFENKEELKKSGIPRILLFLSTLSEETSENRKICKRLVEKWSRPVYELSARHSDVGPKGRIFDIYDLLDEERRKQKREKKRKPSEIHDHELSWSRQIGPRYGENGYRHHAAIPESSSIEYIKRPRLQMDPTEVKACGQSSEQRRIRQLVGKVSGRKKTGQAYQPSVEGRGLVGIQK